MKTCAHLRRRTALLFVGMLLPLVAILSIWWPVVHKYQVFGLSVTPALIQELRSKPDAAVLGEIGRQSLVVSPYLDSPGALHNAAESILGGELALPRHRRIPISSPFRLEDLDQDGETLGLHLGSLTDVRVLLDAYARDPREVFLATAVQRYAEFAKAEREAWLPHGFLWNDHAIAARISVSAELWRLARNHPKYGPILEMVLPLHVWRSMRFLADPAQFTYATNHGVMQNVALLQAGAAFPEIPGASELAQLAMSRLTAQLGHYLSSEGMVLEHSAGYHKHGVELLIIAIRAAELAGLPPPAWKPRVSKARALLEIIRRPDGSLPRFGNTSGDPEKVGDFTTLSMPQLQDGLTALPLSGYAFWRDSGPTPCSANGTHLSFAASLFPGHGHKLADEGSVMLWAGGRVWIDNTGYWPYGFEGRTDVDGWRGSNAPHLEGETRDEPRLPVLDHAQFEDGLLFFEFSRRSPQNTTIQRQVIGLNGRIWLVIDSAENTQGRPLKSLWTFAPDMQVAAETGSASGGGYAVSDPTLACALDIRFPPNDLPDSRLLRGQLAPFGGWMMWNGERMSTTALELSSSNSRGVVLLALREAGEAAAGLDAWQEDSDQEWQATLRLPANGQVEIVRDHNKITVVNEHGRKTFLLKELPAQDAERTRIAASLHELAERFPSRRDYIPWRLNATKYLSAFAILVLTILGLVIWRFPRFTCPLSLAGLTGWIMVTLWLHFVYFQ